MPTRPANPHHLAERLKALARMRSKKLHPVRKHAQAWRQLWRYDGPEALDLLVAWTAARIRYAGAKKAVVGVSGGVDSALVACILARAFPAGTLGYILPADSTAADGEDARRLLAALGLPVREIDLGPALAALRPLLTRARPGTNADGNLKTRLRTLTLFHEAAVHRGVYVGTGDLDEGFVGYYTKGSGSDLSPIGSLHKREVRGLVRLALAPISRKLADYFANKPADAGLIPGRLAEEDLGVSYDEIERAVDLLVETCNLYEGGPVPVELDLFSERFARSGLPEATLLRVVELVYRARHKAMGAPTLWRRDDVLSGLWEFESE